MPDGVLWFGLPPKSVKIDVWSHDANGSIQQEWKKEHMEFRKVPDGKVVQMSTGFEKFGTIFQSQASTGDARLYNSKFKFQYKPYLEVSVSSTHIGEIIGESASAEAAVRFYMKKNTDESILGNRGIYRAVKTGRSSNYTLTAPSVSLFFVTLPSIEFSPPVVGEETGGYAPGILTGDSQNPEGSTFVSPTSPYTFLRAYVAQTVCKTVGGGSARAISRAAIWFSPSQKQEAQPTQKSSNPKYPDVTAAFEFGNP